MGVSGASIPPSRAASEHSPIMAPRALVGNSSMEYVTPPVKHTATITLPIRKNAILAQLIPGMEMQSKEPATKKKNYVWSLAPRLQSGSFKNEPSLNTTVSSVSFTVRLYDQNVNPSSPNRPEVVGEILWKISSVRITDGRT